MVCDEQVFRKGGGRRNGQGPLHALKRRRSSLLRRDLFGDVMVMVVMAKTVSFMGLARQRGQNVLVVVVVMRMRLEPLGPIAQRRVSSVAVFIAFGIIVLGFPALGTRSSFTTCFCLVDGIWWHVIHLIPSSQSVARRR